MKKSEVEKEVEEFRIKNAVGESVEDCFPAWYLYKEYGLSEQTAIKQTSEISEGQDGRGYDYGIDAFTLWPLNNPEKLIIIQAKYTDNINYISKGFEDLVRSVSKIRDIINNITSPDTENKVIINLRAKLNQLPNDIKSKLKLEFVLLHLSEMDYEMISNKTKKSQNSLKDEFERLFIDFTFFIKIIGPRDIQNGIVITPPEKESITIKSEMIKIEASVSSDKKAFLYFTLTKLSDFVELYRSRRDELFSKNVRYFITSRKNTDKGPAGKMTETLKEICIEKKLEPNIFAFYNNGITLYGTDFKIEENKVSIKNAYVLNGGQTIKNAYFFYYNSKYNSKIDSDKWNEILIPLKILIVESDQCMDEELVRNVAINNNHQNPVTYVALRSNDPIQIKLEQKFKKNRIFYERQQGAFENYQGSRPEWIEENFSNTNGRCVKIVDIARSICAVEGKMNYAHSPSDIFESDSIYKFCFSDEKISSIKFLVFLQNLHNLLPTILKKDLNLNDEDNYIRPSKLLYYTMSLLVRYIIKEEKMNVVYDYGMHLVSKNSDSRDKISKLLNNYHSGIKRTLEDNFLDLKEPRSEELNEAFEKSLNKLRLKNIDVFRKIKEWEMKFPEDEDS